MPVARKHLAVSARPHRRGLWLSAIALLLLSASATTTFAVSARVTSGTRSTIARVAYRPWEVTFGEAAREGGESGSFHPGGGWCARTTTQGSTPWGRWSAELITCVHAPLRRGPTVAERENVAIDSKERSP